MNLLENKASTSKDFLHIGEEILEELAQLKIDLTKINPSDMLDKWAVKFSEDFLAKINTCCTIKCSLDMTYTHSEPPIIEEPLHTKFDDANLLSESTLSENDCLATLSPGRFPSNRMIDYGNLSISKL